MADEDGAHAHALATRLVDTLYAEAMQLTEEAQAYFDQAGPASAPHLPPIVRVGMACETLKLTTRLMQVIAWLLARRAGGDPARDVSPEMLGEDVESDAEVVAYMPPEAQALVARSLDLHARARRLATAGEEVRPTPSPARSLLQRLQRSL